MRVDGGYEIEFAYICVNIYIYIRLYFEVLRFCFNVGIGNTKDPHPIQTLMV